VRGLPAARVRDFGAGTALQRLADGRNRAIRASHCPAGTNKWNKVEHQLFSSISLKWRGQPSVRHDIIVNVSAITTIRKGLMVRAEIDPA
jgi:Rhodopirellula transposase DDE domain